MKVTDDEYVRDSSKALLELVNDVVKSDSSMTSTTIGKLFGDEGAYDGNDIFRYLR
jgi:hypothetical protein